MSDTTPDISASAQKDMPIYLKVRADVRLRVDQGEYAPGTAIPSENELAAQYGTTRLTVRNAIDALVEEGIVRRVHGKGAFVVGGIAHGSAVPPQGFRAHQERRLHQASVRILESSIRPAGPVYARLFGIPEDGDLYQVRRLNSIDGAPASIERALIPCALFPGIEDVDIQVFSLYEAYAQRGHAVARAVERLEVAELTAREARLLKAVAGEPALVTSCVSYDAAGTPLECARMIEPGSTASWRQRW